VSEFLFHSKLERKYELNFCTLLTKFDVQMDVNIYKSKKTAVYTQVNGE